MEIFKQFFGGENPFGGTGGGGGNANVKGSFGGGGAGDSPLDGADGATAEAVPMPAESQLHQVSTARVARSAYASVALQLGV